MNEMTALIVKRAAFYNAQFGTGRALGEMETTIAVLHELRAIVVHEMKTLTNSEYEEALQAATNQLEEETK